jgi:hypothetical protein
MNKPWYWPDTQGFLAVAIISIMSGVLLILLLRPVTLTDTAGGMLTTIVGVLLASLKDVFAFYFNSSSSSKTKDETISNMAASAADTPKAPPDPPKQSASARLDSLLAQPLTK